VFQAIHQQFPPFRRHRIIGNRHLQTVLGAYIPVEAPPTPILHRVESYDGDTLLVYENSPEGWIEGDPVVLLSPGLAGSIQSKYMQRITCKLLGEGVKVYRQELRGFGESYRESWGHCHAGKSEDIAAMIENITSWVPDSPFFLVGFSMSGNIALKWLGEAGDNTPSQFQGMLAVAPPIDLMECCVSLRRGMSRLYDWSFIRNLHKLVAKRRAECPDFVDMPLERLPKRLREFDDQFTAPLIGYTGYQDYYEECGAKHVIGNIRKPTLIIAAADDPVVPVNVFDDCENEHVALYVTEHGGHLGYIGANNGPDPDRRWIDWRVLDWVQAGIESLAKRELNETTERAVMPTQTAAEDQLTAP